MLKNYILLFVLIFNPIRVFSNAPGAPLNGYDEIDFKNDLISPVQYQKSKNILLYGTLGVLGLISTKSLTIDPVQDYMSDSKPLGTLAPIGDIMGRMVPNLAYIGYQTLSVKDEHSYRRSLYMFKTSVFAGGSTFFLKRLFNERRPSGKDRNSFPSGHTTTAFAFAKVIEMEHPSYKYYAYGLSTLVGLSRMNDNAHYIPVSYTHLTLPTTPYV